jgi:hypothetical protein
MIDCAASLTLLLDCSRDSSRMGRRAVIPALGAFISILVVTGNIGLAPAVSAEERVSVKS